MAKTRATNVNINFVVNSKELEKANDLLLKSSKATDNVNKTLAKTNTQVKSVGTSMKKAADDSTKAWTSLSNVIKTVSFAFIASEVLQLFKNVVAVTGEFQKMEAVLTNTLGSNSKARLAMAEIVKFATRTPFAVNELTASFVKLANQGFVPTQKEMTKLGDLAASTGKQFDQLTEAIIDAQVGEFERLKEFGIRAKKEGDNVTFAFKGVETQVKFTNEEIRNYILSLGEAEGVTGAMAAISATLAGQVSNIGDNFTQLFKNLGDLSNGPLAEFFRLFNAGLASINETMAIANMKAIDLAEIPLKRFREAFTAANEAIKSGGDFAKMNQLFFDLTAAINSTNEDIKANTDLIEVMTAAGEGESETVKKLTADLEIYKAELNGYKEIRQDINKVSKEYTDNLKKISEAEAAARKAAAEANAQMMRDRRAKGVQQKPRSAPNATGDLIGGLMGSIEKPDFSIGIEVTPFIPLDNWDKLEQDFREHATDLATMGIDSTVDFFIANENAELQSLNNRLSALRAFYDEQQRLAGDNDKAKEQLRAKEERETAELQKNIAMKEWQTRRNAVRADIAGGVAKNIASYAWPFWVLPVAATLAQGAIQLAAIDRAKPRFAKGVIDLQGPGTTTSDSIDAKLSKHESVMTASETMSSMSILKAIRARKLNDKILQEIMSGKSGGSAGAIFDDSRIVSGIENLKTSMPDVVEQAGVVFRVYTKGSNFKQKIRAKSMTS